MRKRSLVVMVVLGLAGWSYAEPYATGFEYADVDAMLADGWVCPVLTPQLVTDTVHSGSKALKLSPRVLMERPLNEFGTLNLWVYDAGLICTSNADGPRWGISKGEEAIAGMLWHRNFMNSAVAYGANIGFSNDVKLSTWWSGTWLHAGDPASPSRGTAGWMNWEIAYYPDGLIEVNLLVDPNGGGAKAHSSREVGVPGPTAEGTLSSVEFANPATGGADAIYLLGSWNNPSVFGDLIVDDLTWTPIPEPSMMGLLGLGALAVTRRRQGARV